MRTKVFILKLGDLVAVHRVSQDHQSWQLTFANLHELVSGLKTNVTAPAITGNHDLSPIDFVLGCFVVDMQEGVHEVAGTARSLGFWSQAIVDIKDDAVVLVSPSNHQLIVQLCRQGDGTATMGPNQGGTVCAARL